LIYPEKEISMRIGICASFHQAPQISRFPIDYLEVNAQSFFQPEQSQEAFLERLGEARRLPIPIEVANGFFPGDLKLVETPTQPIDRQRIERYVRTALRRAEQAGIRLIVFGSGTARACPPRYDQEDATRQIRQHLAIWSEWAREYGVGFVLEPLRYEETNVLNTVEESGALVAEIASSGAKLLIDTFHLSNNGEDPETITPYLPLLAHVHVAERQGRAAPGRHGEDLRPYFSVLRRAGYDGRISLECHWHDFPAEVLPAITALREQWEQAGREIQ
jgi:sugar phosphate isomerase/epimerase